VSDAHLDPDEDSELRRLHVLKGFGMVAGSVVSRYEALRGRDRRRGVRNPDDATVVTPINKHDFPTAKQTAKQTAKLAAKRQASHSEGLVTDTREIFGERPEPRRGRGIFRR
jgi:hypothetical protein